MSITSKFWWQLPTAEKASPLATDDPVHSVLFEHVRGVEQDQHAIHVQNLRNAKLYTNRILQGLDWGTHTERNANYAPVSLSAENLTASVVDTVTALVGKHRPKPTPVVRDADFSVELIGRQLDRYLYGLFKRLNVYDKTIQVFNDACWAQIGALKVGIDGDELFCERVNPDEIIVDQREAVNGEPIQLHQRKLIPKVVLLAMYPEKAEQIRKAHTENMVWTTSRSPESGQMVVIESWKLPDGHGPGRHVICGDGVTFVDEVYERERFPFVFFRWCPLPTGFYGKSLVEEVVPFQLRINELNKQIRRGQDVMCQPRVFLDQGSKIVKEQLDGTALRVITFRGREPIPAIWPAMPPEIYAERERIRSAAFEYAGISQLTAQAKLPDGARLDSSKAIREVSRKDDGRFARQAIRYENLHLELAEHLLELSAILYKGRTNTKVQFAQRGLIEDIEWSDVHDLVTKKQFVLQIEASSLLNMTPAAREDILSNWAQQGIVSPEEYRHLLNNPDLEEQQDLGSIGIDDIKRTAELLDKDEYTPPIPEQNLQYGVGYMHKTLLKRRRQKNVPQAILDNYRDWISQAQGILDKAEQMRAKQEAALQEQILMQQQAQQSFQVPTNPETGSPVSSVPVTTQGTPVDRSGVGN